LIKRAFEDSMDASTQMSIPTQLIEGFNPGTPFLQFCGSALATSEVFETYWRFAADAPRIVPGAEIVI